MVGLSDGLHWYLLDLVDKLKERGKSGKRLVTRHSRTTVFAIVCVFVVLMAKASLASSLPRVAAAPQAIAYVHDGSRDPETEGWTYVGPGQQQGILGAGLEQTASGPHAFWRIQDLLTDGGHRYIIPLDDPAALGIWRLTAQLRIVDSPELPNGDGVGGVGFLVNDGRNQWSIYLGNSSVGPVDDSFRPTGRYHLARTHPLETRDDYHELAIVFLPNNPGDGDDTADFWVDDQPVFRGVSRSEIATQAGQYVYFGSVSRSGTGDANFAWVCFESNLDPASIDVPPGRARGCGLPSTATPSATVTLTASATPTATLTPTRTPAPVTPSITPTRGPTTPAVCVCRIVRERVPAVVVDDAVANPERYYGWLYPLDPGKPPGPANPPRTCLTLSNVGLDYHPVWNKPQWRVGCP